MRRGFADDIERMRGRAGHLVEDEHVVVEFLGERPKRRLVQLVERGAVDRRKRKAVAEPDRLSAIAQGQGGEQGDLGVAAPHDARVAPGGDLRAKIALRGIVNEQLRLVALSLQPLEEEVDDRAHARADLLAAGARYWRCRRDRRAPRSRERPSRHSAAADGRRGRAVAPAHAAARAPRNSRRFSRAPRGGSRRRNGRPGRRRLTVARREGRRRRLATKSTRSGANGAASCWRAASSFARSARLFNRSVVRAGAISEHVGHGSGPRIVAHAAITSLQPRSSVFGARPTTRIALPKRPPAPASIVSTTPMSSVSTLWPG